MYQNSKHPCTYTILTSDPPARLWCYSAKKLQEDLNRTCAGQTLQAAFLSYPEYRYHAQPEKNVMNLTEFGGELCLVFEQAAVFLRIHAEGMVEYQITGIPQLHMQEVVDFLPETKQIQEKCYHNLKDVFELHYEGQKLRYVKVTATNTWSFRIEGFEDSLAQLAANHCDLPCSIHFRLGSGLEMIFSGDSLEYSWLEICRP